MASEKKRKTGKEQKEEIAPISTIQLLNLPMEIQAKVGTNLKMTDMTLLNAVSKGGKEMFAYCLKRLERVYVCQDDAKMFGQYGNSPRRALLQRCLDESKNSCKFVQYCGGVAWPKDSEVKSIQKMPNLRKLEIVGGCSFKKNGMQSNNEAIAWYFLEDIFPTESKQFSSLIFKDDGFRFEGHRESFVEVNFPSITKNIIEQFKQSPMRHFVFPRGCGFTQGMIQQFLQTSSFPRLEQLEINCNWLENSLLLQLGQTLKQLKILELVQFDTRENVWGHLRNEEVQKELRNSLQMLVKGCPKLESVGLFHEVEHPKKFETQNRICWTCLEGVWSAKVFLMLQDEEQKTVQLTSALLHAINPTGVWDSLDVAGCDTTIKYILEFSKTLKKVRHLNYVSYNETNHDVIMHLRPEMDVKTFVQTFQDAAQKLELETFRLLPDPFRRYPETRLVMNLRTRHMMTEFLSQTNIAFLDPWIAALQPLSFEHVFARSFEHNVPFFRVPKNTKKMHHLFESLAQYGKESLKSLKFHFHPSIELKANDFRLQEEKRMDSEHILSLVMDLPLLTEVDLSRFILFDKRPHIVSFNKVVAQENKSLEKVKLLYDTKDCPLKGAEKDKYTDVEYQIIPRASETLEKVLDPFEIFQFVETQRKLQRLVYHVSTYSVGHSASFKGTLPRLNSPHLQLRYLSFSFSRTTIEWDELTNLFLDLPHLVSLGIWTSDAILGDPSIDKVLEKEYQTALLHMLVSICPKSLEAITITWNGDDKFAPPEPLLDSPLPNKRAPERELFVLVKQGATGPLFEKKASSTSFKKGGTTGPFFVTEPLFVTPQEHLQNEDERSLWVEGKLIPALNLPTTAAFQIGAI
jgi:hypothetical protein